MAVIPSLQAWQRVSNAVKRIEAGETRHAPTIAPTRYEAVVFRVTGPISGGYYPAELLAWDEDTVDWVVTEECYVIG